MHKWQEITSDLYHLIKPTGGIIYSRYSNSLNKRYIVDEAWMEFDMNEFKYIDLKGPFIYIMQQERQRTH